tara:strand:+ start:14069 stop:14224 length:156 start_codon:yes stop_codon:yes gene_type:complete
MYQGDLQSLRIGIRWHHYFEKVGGISLTMMGLYYSMSIILSSESVEHVSNW